MKNVLILAKIFMKLVLVRERLQKQSAVNNLEVVEDRVNKSLEVVRKCVLLTILINALQIAHFFNNLI